MLANKLVHLHCWMRTVDVTIKMAVLMEPAVIYNVNLCDSHFVYSSIPICHHMTHKQVQKRF